MCVPGWRGQAGGAGQLRIEASHREGQERLWRSVGAVGEGGAGQGQGLGAPSVAGGGGALGTGGFRNPERFATLATEQCALGIKGQVTSPKTGAGSNLWSLPSPAQAKAMRTGMQSANDIQ